MAEEHRRLDTGRSLNSWIALCSCTAIIRGATMAEAVDNHHQHRRDMLALNDMRIPAEHTTITEYDGFAANIAIISALGLDSTKAVSVTIVMDGSGCSITAVMLGDPDELGVIPDVVSRFHLVPKQEETP